MKALFMESKAAAQCLAYAKGQEWDEADTQNLLDRCYANSSYTPGKRGMSVEDWWVGKCLDGDSHKRLSIGSMFNWAMSPEGHEYWEGVTQRDYGEGLF